MHTKKDMSTKRFWLPALFGGILLLIAATLVLFFFYKDRAENNLLKIANYMKVQCSTYSHYNEGAESQALLRAVESSRDIQKRLEGHTASGREVTENDLHQFADSLWLHGIILLDAEGNRICGYAKDTAVEEKLLSVYNMQTALSGDGYTQRSYAKRIHLDDGGYINMAATARSDAEGIIVSYFYISPETAQSYSLTQQSLLEGYEVSSDGILVVADEGSVIASNDTDLINQKVADNEVLQAIKEHADSQHIYHIAVNHSYGLMLKQRDYYIFAYIADRSVFAGLPMNLLAIMLVYVVIVTLTWFLLTASKRKFQKHEAQQEIRYREELLESAKRADAANEAKTLFLQRMSHDIRTPINGICGMLDVAAYYADDLEKQAECRTKIRDASNLLLELVNEVLDMGKLESGEVVLEHQPFDLNNVINEVLVVIEKLANEQDLTLEKGNMDVRHWNLLGSSRHLKRLLMNIMSNAVKYNKPGGSIYFDCREISGDPEGKTTIEFICRDTGIGMSPEYQEKIFEPFTQENTNPQSKYGGSGLGMSISKGLVDKMEGQISFESKVGEGTTFYMTLPFEIDPEKTDTEKTKEGESYDISGCHILLVEDNELNMEIAEFSLQIEGATVTKAWNGKEAVELFQRSDPGEYDAILMDVMMPVMGGYEAAGIIRGLERPDATSIPIIATTANAFTDDRIKTREAGLNAHVSKPLDMEKLKKILVRLVNAQRNSGGGGTPPWFELIKKK